MKNTKTCFWFTCRVIFISKISVESLEHYLNWVTLLQVPLECFSVCIVVFYEQEDVFFSQNNSRTYVHNSTCRWLGASCQTYKVNKIFTSSHITKITIKQWRGNWSWRAVRGRLNPQESGYYPFIPAQPWGVLLSPCTAHIPAELCDLARVKLSVGMEHQPLCIAATQAEIYDHSSKNWGVAEAKTMVVMQDANSPPVQQDCCTDHRGFLSAPPTAQTCIKLAWPWPCPVQREVDGLGVILKLRPSGNMVTL